MTKNNEIKIFHLVEGAGEARGLTVIIDVFRAFSVAAYAFAGGAERSSLLADWRKPCRLKEKIPFPTGRGTR